MKKASVLFFITILVISSCSGSGIRPVQPIPFDKRLLVAVGDFQNLSGDTNYNGLMDGLTGNFIYELHDTQCFRLMERSQLKGLLDESKLGMTGLTDPSKTKQIGKLLGVDAILFVNLASVNYTSDQKSALIAQTEKETYDIALDARLVAVETGEILAASKISRTFQNEYSSALFLKSGDKADPRALVKKGLDESVKFLANDLAYQLSHR